MVLAGARVACVVLMMLAPGLATAADLPTEPPVPPIAPASYTPSPPDWTVTIGFEARMIPAWPGAPDGKFSFIGFPLVDIHKAGTPPDFFGARDSFSFPVVNLPQFKLGPAVGLIWQRKASDYTALNGLGNINYAIQAGGFAEFWPVPWLRLRGEVRQGIGGETGVTGDVFLDGVVPLGQFRWSGGPRLTLQTAAAVAPYFSITATQSATSTIAGLPKLPVYSADGGLYSYGAGTQLEYSFNRQWAAHVFTEYQRLTGSAAASPLVTERGSPNQITFGLGATYSFDMHPLW